MKSSYKTVGLAFLILAAALPELKAQAEPLKTMSLNGATGLYSIPSGRVSWEQDNFGIAGAYHFTMTRHSDMAHNLALNIGFLKWIEVSAAFDIQPNYWTWDERDHDLILGAKFQLPFKNPAFPAVALGGNFQFLNIGSNDHNTPFFPGWGWVNSVNRDMVPDWMKQWIEYDGFGLSAQAYVAITYTAQIFGTPVETTGVVGKTFVLNTNNQLRRSKSNIDFGMGFDVILFPKVLQNYLHLLIDYSNFAYSNDPLGSSSDWRGVMDTGFRIDLAQIPGMEKFKFTIDVMLTDALDHYERSFSTGLVFGAGIK
jgi:hypothetical protein